MNPENLPYVARKGYQYGVDFHTPEIFFNRYLKGKDRVKVFEITPCLNEDFHSSVGKSYAVYLPYGERYTTSIHLRFRGVPKIIRFETDDSILINFDALKEGFCYDRNRVTLLREITIEQLKRIIVIENMLGENDDN